METSDWLALLLPLLVGILLGAFFFGGLYVTIQRSLGARLPGLWFLCSLLLRTLVVVAGFHFISDGSWQRLVTSLCGFIVARMVIARALHQAKARPNCAGVEAQKCA